MKIISLLVSLLITSLNSFACLYASQNRIFPIGLCAKGLVVVEMRLVRGEEAEVVKYMSNGQERSVEKLNPIWKGICYLTLFDKNHRRIESKVIDTLMRLTPQSYSEAIHRSYHKGVEAANEINDLVLAQPISLSFCNYSDNCSLASLEKDTINGTAYIKLLKTKHEVVVLKDSSSIASNYISYFAGFDYDNSNEKINILTSLLSINSIRTFKIGDNIVVLVHLGAGHKGEKVINNKEVHAEVFNKLEESTFTEPVLHHGHGFDFFIME